MTIPALEQLRLARHQHAEPEDRDHDARLDGQEHPRRHRLPWRERAEEPAAAFALEEILQLGRRGKPLQHPDLQLHAQPRPLLQPPGDDPDHQPEERDLADRDRRNLCAHPPSVRCRYARPGAGVNGFSVLEERPEASGQGRARGLVFVLEEDEGALPGLGADALGPGRQVLVGVFDPPQAEVAPVGGGTRSPPVCPSSSTSARQSARAVLAQDRRHLVVEPGLVAELEGGGRIRRAGARGTPRAAPRPSSCWAEAGRAPGRAWGRAWPPSPGKGEVVAHVAQPLLVRDPLGRLEDEREPVRRLAGPPLQQLARGHPVERVVDLDGGEALGVEAAASALPAASPGRSGPSTPCSCSRWCRPGPASHDPSSSQAAVALALKRSA